MRAKCRRQFSILLLFVLFFTGIFYVNNLADSYAVMPSIQITSEGGACSSSEILDPTLNSILDQGYQNPSFTQQNIQPNYSRLTSRIALDSLTIHSVYLISIQSYVAIVVTHTHKQYSLIELIDYIHNQDGHK